LSNLTYFSSSKMNLFLNLLFGVTLIFFGSFVCYASNGLNKNMNNSEEITFLFRMSHVRPTKNDQTFCTYMAFDTNESLYVTRFQPVMSTLNVHHISLNGCFGFPAENVNKTQVWDCSELHEKALLRRFDDLPEGSCVAFRIPYFFTDRGSE